MMKKTKAVFLSTGLLATAVSASQTGFAAPSQATIGNYLNAFHANPAQVMNSIPYKRDAQGRVIQKTESIFSASDIRSRNYVVYKDQVRQDMCTIQGGSRTCVKDIIPGRAAFDVNDLVEDLVDNGSSPLRTLEEIDARRLQSASINSSPWSDGYWPIFRGGTASRYADPSATVSHDWKANHTYSLDNEMRKILSTQNASSIDLLSPAEKYDLLVGDLNGTMTRAMWNEGKQYYDNYNGQVQTWMGLCHGWAPASYMLPRPTSLITLTAADGRTKIRFYPSDIKALGTQLWAKTDPPSKFIGGRCNDKAPQRDAQGRVTSQKCFDTNPGTWHMAVVNQIGVSRRSMVMDATFDYEVWNQPVLSYSYTYFHPETRARVQSAQQAKVALKDYTSDKFRNYRSPKTAYVVGVAMDVTYLVETTPGPHRTPTDSPMQDARRSVQYLYDLELDVNGQIIGGEWYSNAHPDFLWTPPKGARAVSIADQMIKEGWNGKTPVPASYTAAARKASVYGQPLAKIVDTLFALSAAGIQQ